MDKVIEIIANLAGVGSFLLAITLLFIRKELQENNKSINTLSETIKLQQIFFGKIKNVINNPTINNYSTFRKKRYNKRKIYEKQK